MTEETIVRMANQIAAFFATYPHEQAVEGTYDHIKKFWDPRMRKQLAEKVAAGGNGLSAIALEAARKFPPVEARAG
jgi:formate dehydrogenase subunit delta